MVFNFQQLQQISIKISLFSTRAFANYFVLNINHRYGMWGGGSGERCGGTYKLPPLPSTSSSNALPQISSMDHIHPPYVISILNF
jgi:hypothetical protein